ncbi:MAG TPA: hypothetical protein VJ975_10305 [Candidatus Limnocylindria bacterium]|nr:hypothetical protein [Candidatus Limnocylindria bacterium]
MSDNDIHGIEKGWNVKSIDGHGIGSVEEVTETYILVKSGLINSDHRYLPARVLEHVRPELNEIGISLTQEEVEQGDWSEVPTELPRTSGAPLNAEEYEDNDPRNGEVREPDRPTATYTR